jgi:hypothetical protein
MDGHLAVLGRRRGRGRDGAPAPTDGLEHEAVPQLWNFRRVAGHAPEDGDQQLVGERVDRRGGGHGGGRRGGGGGGRRAAGGGHAQGSEAIATARSDLALLLAAFRALDAESEIEFA